MVENQKASERLLLELKEKRLKYEEKQAEREVEQRHEERMFNSVIDYANAEWILLWVNTNTQCISIWFHACY